MTRLVYYVRVHFILASIRGPFLDQGSLPAGGLNASCVLVDLLAPERCICVNFGATLPLAVEIIVMTGSHEPSKARIPLRLDSHCQMRYSLDSSPELTSDTHTPNSSVPSTRPPSPGKQSTRPVESNTLLTTIAAQERRVLELKEELQKAEEALNKLKIQWTTVESVKTTNEQHDRRHLPPPKLLQVLDGVPSGDDLLKRRQRIDRGTAQLPSSLRTGQRKVFSGSRHARTLSLLAKPTTRSPLTETNLMNCDRSAVRETPQTLHESQVCSAVPTETLDKDVLLQTGKQLVGDLKTGLWTFFEDLKDVTLGDDASKQMQRISTRSQAHKHLQYGKTTALPQSFAGSAEQQKDKIKGSENLERDESSHGVKVGSSSNVPNLADLSPDPALAQEKMRMDTKMMDNSDPEDGWDSWDSPNPSTGNQIQRISNFEPLISPLTEDSTPRTSLR